MIKLGKIIIPIIIISLSQSLVAGKVTEPATTEVVDVPLDYSSWYLGIGFIAAKFHACNKSKGCTYEDATYGGLIRVGYDFNRYFGIEARAARTFWGKGPFGGAPLQHIGLYAKPQLPIGEQINLYGLIGYGYTKNLGKGARLKYFDNSYGFAGGLGIEYYLPSNKKNNADSRNGWSLFADYQRFLIKSNTPTMDALTLGLRYDF